MFCSTAHCMFLKVYAVIALLYYLALRYLLDRGAVEYAHQLVSSAETIEEIIRPPESRRVD